MPIYLMLDHGGVLDGEITTEVYEQDLLLSDLGEGMKNIVRNGVIWVMQLNELVEQYDYHVVFHSKNREEDQVRIWRQLQHACLQKGLTFPAIEAMAVYDPQRYDGVKPHAPILTTKAHGIMVVGYGEDRDGKACIRQALTQALKLAETDRASHIIIDDGPTVIAHANQEGYRTYWIHEEGITLAEAIDAIHQEACQARSYIRC